MLAFQPGVALIKNQAFTQRLNLSILSRPNGDSFNAAKKNLKAKVRGWDLPLTQDLESYYLVNRSLASSHSPLEKTPLR